MTFQEFDKLYENYWRLVRAMAADYAHSPLDAEDIVQAVWERVWAGAPTPSELANPKAYLRQVVRRVADDYYGASPQAVSWEWLTEADLGGRLPLEEMGLVADLRGRRS